MIGQGIFIFNNSFTDRSLYLSHLVYLHQIFGQNYELLMAAQAAIFAVLIPLIYWIGRSLNVRSPGFAAALVAMFRGINSIAASSLIDLANPKMILSDFPAAIGVALIILTTCEWLKKPEQRSHYAIWVGGAIGLTLMIRPHALVFLALVPIYALLKFGIQWRQWLLACLLIGLGVMAITLPWEMRTLARGGIMYRSLVIKVQDVIGTRYVPVNQEGSLSPGKNILSSIACDDHIRQLRDAQPDVKIITMAGQCDRNLERAIRRHGVLFYMTKPVSPSLIRELTTHLLKSMPTAEPAPGAKPADRNRNPREPAARRTRRGNP